MRFLRLRRLLVFSALGLCPLLLLAFLASQMEQRLFRQKAELLLSELQSLELRKTPWIDAQTRLQHWGNRLELGTPCDPRGCSARIELIEPVLDFVSRRNLFDKLDDYFRWRLKLSYDVGPFSRIENSLLEAYLRFGGRPAKITATIGMRDGVVWSKGVDIRIETYGHPAGWSGTDRLGFTLIASSSSRPRFDYYNGQRIDPQLALHPNYTIGRPGGCTICVAGWANFTPYAESSDVHRLMQFDLSCLTRWHPCVSQSEIMPAAWAQYLADRPRVEAAWSQPDCSLSELRLLGRDSINIYVAEVISYRKIGDSQQIADLLVLQQMKGSERSADETLEVPVSQLVASSSTNPRVGARIVLFEGFGPPEYLRTAPEFTCAGTAATNTNLDLIRQGIEQDYGAKVKAP